MDKTKKIVLLVSPIQLGFLTNLIHDWIKEEWGITERIPQWIIDVKNELDTKYNEGYPE
jgi:hypothetical protein